MRERAVAPTVSAAANHGTDRTRLLYVYAVHPTSGVTVRDCGRCSSDRSRTPVVRIRDTYPFLKSTEHFSKQPSRLNYEHYETASFFENWKCSNTFREKL